MYAVIGNALRHLHRNVGLVGGILKGVQLLSTLPRGSGAMGFYRRSSAALNSRIGRVRQILPLTGISAPVISADSLDAI